MVSSQGLSKAFRRGRQTGSLHLPARELSSIPSEVFQLQEHLEEDEKFWDCVDLVKMDLSINEIESIPGEIKNLDFLTSLKLRQNKLTLIPVELFDLEQLQFLDLSHNKLVGDFPNEIGQLRQLKELHLSSNNLSRLPESVGDIIELEVILLDQNELTQLPESLGCLKKLTKLNVSSNKLTSLPETFGFLEKLTSLELSKNGLSCVNLQNLRNLISVDLRQNSLNRFPFLPCGKASLDQLFLGFNRLNNIPENAFENVKQSLTVLDVRDNQLTVLPGSICHLVHLKLIDISNNDLSDLPAGLGYLKDLNRLLLEGNPFRRIRRSVISSGHEAIKKYLRSRGAPPKGIDTMQEEFDEFSERDAAPSTNYQYLIQDALGSKHLILEDLSLTSFPPEVVLKVDVLRNITKLSLNANKLVALPEEVSLYCPALESLRVEDNKLRSLPSNLMHLRSLRVLSLRKNMLDHTSFDRILTPNLPITQSLLELDICNNSFSALPKCISYFKCLHSLLASCNQIVDLDSVAWDSMSALSTTNFSDNQLKSISNIYMTPKLIAINIENNNLSQIPAELGLCGSLRTLLISGNPQRTIRSNTILKGTVAILESLKLRLPSKQVISNDTFPGDTGSIEDNSDHVQSNQETKGELIPQYKFQIEELERQLEDFSLSAAKKYSLKKQIAKCRSLKIREERKARA